jgi:hypothetical protein
MNPKRETEDGEAVRCSAWLDRWTLILIVQIGSLVLMVIDLIVCICRKGF